MRYELRDVHPVREHADQELRVRVMDVTKRPMEREIGVICNIPGVGWCAESAKTEAEVSHLDTMGSALDWLIEEFETTRVDVTFTLEEARSLQKAIESYNILSTFGRRDIDRANRKIADAIREATLRDGSY